MRVLIVHNYYQNPGGEDLVVEQEAALLQRAGHHVVRYHRSNSDLDALRWWNKALMPKRMLWNSDAVRDLRAIIAREQPEVAHFHNTHFMISPAAYYACRKAGLPVVQTLHNFRLCCPNAICFRDGHICEDCVGQHPPYAGILHGCFRQSRVQTAMICNVLTIHRHLKTWENQVTLYIALTQFARQLYVKGRLPADRFVVKPNFLHPDPGAGQGSGAYGLAIGRLTVEKGWRTLLAALQRQPQVPMILVGNGPLREEIENWQHRSNGARVTFLGQRPHQEVLAMMRQARFLVFPSEWYEGFPMALTEAFASGLPVVTSRLGAMAEIVEEDRTGLLFEPGNAADLAARLAWAWEHPAHMREMGREARHEFERHYTAEHNYAMLMDIYRTAMERAHSERSAA